MRQMGAADSDFRYEASNGRVYSFSRHGLLLQIQEVAGVERYSIREPVRTVRSGLDPIGEGVADLQDRLNAVKQVEEWISGGFLANTLAPIEIEYVDRIVDFIRTTKIDESACLYFLIFGQAPKQLIFHMRSFLPIPEPDHLSEFFNRFKHHYAVLDVLAHLCATARLEALEMRTKIADFKQKAQKMGLAGEESLSSSVYPGLQTYQDVRRYLSDQLDRLENFAVNSRKYYIRFRQILEEETRYGGSLKAFL